MQLRDLRRERAHIAAYILGIKHPTNHMSVALWQLGQKIHNRQRSGGIVPPVQPKFERG